MPSPHDTKLIINSRNVHVALCSVRGHVRVDIREYYETVYGERPSVRGIAIQADCIDQVIDALTKIRNGMISDGFMTVSPTGQLELKINPFLVYPAEF